MPSALQEQLDKYSAGDATAREQYLDYLTGSSFRQDLFCRAEKPVDHTRRWEPITGLYTCGLFREVERLETDPPHLRRFETPLAMRVPVPYAGVARAFEYLNSAYPRAVPFAELAAQAEDEPAERLAQILLQCAVAGAVDLLAHPHRHASKASERPRVSALARSQAAEGFQANLLCLSVQIDRRVARLLLPLADGTRSQDQLAAELTRILKQREAPDEDTAKSWQKALADPGAEVQRQLHTWCRLHLLESD